MFQTFFRKLKFTNRKRNKNRFFFFEFLSFLSFFFHRLFPAGTERKVIFKGFWIRCNLDYNLWNWMWKRKQKKGKKFSCLFLLRKNILNTEKKRNLHDFYEQSKSWNSKIEQNIKYATPRLLFWKDCCRCRGVCWEVTFVCLTRVPKFRRWVGWEWRLLKKRTRKWCVHKFKTVFSPSNLSLHNRNDEESEDED